MKRVSENRAVLRIGRELFRFRILRFLPWMVLVISLMVTHQFWKNAQNENEQALKIEFDFQVIEARNQVEQHLLAYEELLRGVQGLFAASVSVERKEFRDYIEALNISKNYPGIQSVSFTLLIPRDKIKNHLTSIHREDFPDYTIQPVGLRETYTSIVYIEPFEGRNLRAFGYDNFADPVRRSAMERVRDTGLCTISPKVNLAQEIDTKVQAGFLMWLPVYKNGVPHNTLSERREHLLGWVGASFRMDDLLNSMFNKHTNKLHLEIYDGETITEQSLMHEGDKRPHEKMKSAPRFQTESKLSIDGRTWTLLLHSLPEFERRLYESKSGLIILGGIIVSVLLSLLTAIMIFGHNRALLSAIQLQKELSERKRAEAGERLAEKVFEAVDVAALVTDEKNIIVKVNPAFTEITGYSAEEALGKKTTLLSSGAHSPEFYKEMWKVLTSTGSWQGEIYNRRKNGEFYTEWLSINEVRDNDGKLSNYVALFSDISDRKAEEAAMHNLAHYDPLTGLPNRTLLADRLQQAISSAKREKTRMALMFVDLDKFKPVNDTLGHHVGDLMLKQVAKRMLECLRESDTAARIGGDEFVVLLPLIEETADALAVAEKIRGALNEAFKLVDNELYISSSIGIAVYPEHGLDDKSLLKNADTAMYNAKEAGRNRVMLFDKEMKRTD